MRCPTRSVFALLALTLACSEDATTTFAPAEAGSDPGPAVVASTAELLSISEHASDPFLAELAAVIDEAEATSVQGTLTRFETGVLTAPTPSYRSLESSLFSFQAGAPELSEESDVALVLEVLDLYRSWSEVTLYGIEH